MKTYLHDVIRTPHLGADVEGSCGSDVNESSSGESSRDWLAFCLVETCFQIRVTSRLALDDVRRDVYL